MQTDLIEVGLEFQSRGSAAVLDQMDDLLQKSRQLNRAFGRLKGPTGSGGGAALSASLRQMQSDAAGVFSLLGGDGDQLADRLGKSLGRSFDGFLRSGGSAQTLLKSLEAEAIAVSSRLFTGKRSSGSGDLFSLLFGGAGDLLSTAFSGFASGGQFRVGGAAGRDRNLVGLRLSRGEEVSIKTPGQQRAGDMGRAAAMPNFSFTYQISTPDVAGFRKSQAQLQADALKTAQRTLRRSG